MSFLAAAAAAVSQQTAGGAAPIPDLLWLDAQTGITLRGSTPERLSTWADQSANGHTILTENENQSPVMDSVVLNSYDVPSFDGSNDYVFLNQAIGLVGNVAGATAYFVIGNVSAAAGEVLMAEGSSSSTNPVLAARFSSSAADFAAWGRDDSGSIYLTHDDTAAAPPGVGFEVATWLLETGSSEWWTDGSHPVDADNPESFTAGTMTVNRFAIGALLRATESLHPGFDLAEVRLYSTAHNAATRAAVEAEMKARWNL